MKKLWHGQIIPDEHDLQVQLEAAGLKGIEVAKEKPVKVANACICGQYYLLIYFKRLNRLPSALQAIVIVASR